MKKPVTRYAQTRRHPESGFLLETELLRLALRPHLGPEAVGQLKTLLRKPLNWHHILKLAHRHGVTPLLYWNVRKASVQDTHKTVMKQLKKCFTASGEHNLFLTGKLLKILQVFRESDLPMIPLKGPVCAQTLYPHPALRPFGDLDILVHKEDVSCALSLLASEGYKAPIHAMHSRRMLEKFFNHLALVNDKSGTVVELHWALMPPYFSSSSTTEALWRQGERVSLANEKVPGFSPEALLLFLCQHGSRHAWEGLIGVCDIAALIGKYKALRWDRMMQQAQTLRVERMFFVGLLLAKEMLGVDLPSTVLSRIQTDSFVKKACFRLCQQLFADNSRSNGMLAKLSRSLFQLRMQETTRGKLRLCFYKLILLADSKRTKRLDCRPR